MPSPIQLLSATRDRKNARAAQASRLPAKRFMKSPVNSPLFNGTLHMVRASIQVAATGQTVAVPPLDVAVALDFALLAAKPISAYAEQYGPNGLAISRTILEFATTTANTTYDDSELEGWIDQIVTTNAISPNDGIIFLNPFGLVNKQFSLAGGTGGYHGKASASYVFVNMRGVGITLDDAALKYALALSHEMAELLVDPLADDDNPEVCDPCGPNYISYFINFFDAAGEYIATSQDFPPPFPYAFMINGIVKPAWAAFHAPTDPMGACSYAPLDSFALTSRTAPAAAGSDAGLFVFATINPALFIPQTLIGGNILTNSAAPGQAFAGWTTLPGGLTVNGPVATTADGPSLILVARNSGNATVEFARFDPSKPFPGWGAMPGNFTTPTSPATAAGPGGVFIAARDQTGQVMLIHAAASAPFLGWNPIPGGLITDVSPAMAMRDTTLFILATATDGTIQFNQTDKGTEFVGWQPIPNAPRTVLPPACTAMPGTLFVFVTDTVGQVHVNQAPAGGAFLGWSPIPGGLVTHLPIAAAISKGTLFVIALEAGLGRLQYNQAELGAPFIGWQSQSTVAAAP